MAVIRLFSSLILITPVICLICQEGLISKSHIIQKEFNLNNLYPSRTVFQILDVNTWMNCARLCLLRSVCKSLVYDHISGNCTAYTVTATSSQLTDTLSKYYTEADNLPQTIVGPCSGRACGFYEVCVPDTFTHHHCTVVGRCSTPPDRENADIVSVVENKEVTYKCGPNHANDVEDPVYTSWCIGENRWTATNFNCVYFESGD